MPKVLVTVPCPGCQGSNRVATKTPTRNSSPKAYYTCEICRSRCETVLFVESKDGKLQVQAKTRIQGMSPELVAMLAEEAETVATRAV